MLYTQADRTQAKQVRTLRRWVVLVPTVILLILAIVIFVWFRSHRNFNGWIWSGLCSVLGGAYFIFFYEVYLRPVSLYAKHVNYMLDGRKHETIGILTHIAADAQDKDGMDCYAVTLNIGETANPEDDRLFYFDALKDIPDVPIGTRVAVQCNDRMIASILPAPEETY